MNSKLRNLGRSCTILAGTLCAIPALADHQLFSPAQICSAANSANDDVNFDIYGQLYNTSTTLTWYAICGLGQDQGLDTNDDIVVRFSDANAGSGSNLGCGAIEFNDDWSTLSFTAEKIGCSTAGGCAPPATSTYSGDNYILLSDIRHGGAYTTSLYCYIPPKQGINSSVIRNILLYESAGT